MSDGRKRVTHLTDDARQFCIDFSIENSIEAPSCGSSIHSINLQESAQILTFTDSTTAALRRDALRSVEKARIFSVAGKQSI